MAQIQSFSFYKGEKIALDFQEADYSVVPAVPTDITGWTIKLSILKSDGSKLQKNATITLPATLGQFTFVLTSAETIALGTGGRKYDVQRLDAGNEACLATGVINVLTEVYY